jgi:hypothetical protein
MKLAAKKTEQASAWRELVRRREDFLKIVQLLVDFDEKTGRYARYRDTETHFMRRAIASADPEKVRVFLRHIGGFVYSIVAEVQSPGGLVATAWVHEDGIRQEREGAQPGHPVHSIVCVSDLFDADTDASEPESALVSQAALDLMTERD